MGKIEHGGDLAQEAGMAGTGKRRAVLVMHLANQHAAAPGVVFGCGGLCGICRPCKARAGIDLAHGAAGQALDGDAEEDEIDIGIDGWSGAPIALQHEVAQQAGVRAIGIERENAWKRRLMPETLPEGDLALPTLQILLGEVGNGAGERRVEIDSPLLGQRQDAGRGEQDLGERGEVEPGRLRHLALDRETLRQARGTGDPLPRGIDNAEHPTGDTPGSDGIGQGDKGMIEDGC
jgi:hypothetical protein